MYLFASCRYGSPPANDAAWSWKAPPGEKRGDPNYTPQFISRGPREKKPANAGFEWTDDGSGNF